jgi:hypothetical protein
MIKRIEMSDLCFLCLSNTRINACTQCNLKCHRKCWKEYKKECETSLGIKCPQCKIVIKHTGVTTRLMKKKSSVENIVVTIKNYLNECENTIGIDNKKRIIIQIFSLLLKNMEFVNKHPVFSQTLSDKLHELYKNNDWDYANIVHIQMFGEQIYI